MPPGARGDACALPAASPARGAGPSARGAFSRVTRSRTHRTTRARTGLTRDGAHAGPPSAPRPAQVRARLAIGALLLRHTHNVLEAKNHVERANFLW